MRDSTDLTRRRYDRIAPFYDAMEWVSELLWMTAWRRSLWEQVPSTGQLLEIGVGTGKNLRHHATDMHHVGIDLSPRMLAKARKRASRLGLDIDLQVADVQALPFEDDSFDIAVASFVFCSVPDAVAGLREVHRVLRPGGRLFLLEHVLSARPWLRRLMVLLDPIPLNIWGAHIDRDTEAHVREAGFVDVRVRNRGLDVFIEIQAIAP